MAAQLAMIFDDRPISAPPEFWKFHDANPEVYRLLVRFARELRRSGKESFGIRLPLERVRYELAVVKRTDEFKVNNNFQGPYARLIRATEPDLRDIINIRERRI